MSYTIGMRAAFFFILLASGFARAEAGPEVVLSSALPEALGKGVAWYYDAEFPLPLPKDEAPRIVLSLPNAAAMITDGRASGRLWAWKSSDGYALELPKPDREAVSSALSRDLIYQAYLDRGGNVYLRRGYEDSAEIYTFRLRGTDQVSGASLFFSDEPSRLAVFLRHPDGRLDGTVSETTRGKLLERLERLGGAWPAAAADAQAEVFAGTVTGGGFWVWDSGKGRKASVLDENTVYSLAALSPDGMRLLACGAGNCSLWDAKARKRLSRWPAPGTAGAAAFFPEGERVLLSSAAGLEIREAKTGILLWALEAAGPAAAAAVMPDASFLIRLDASGRATRWKAAAFSDALEEFRKAVAKFDGEEAYAAGRVRFFQGQATDYHNERLAALRARGEPGPQELKSLEELHARELKRFQEDSDNRRRPLREGMGKKRERIYRVEAPASGAYDAGAGGFVVSVGSFSFVARMSGEEAQRLASARLLSLTEWTSSDGESIALDRAPRLYDADRGRVLSLESLP